MSSSAERKASLPKNADHSIFRDYRWVTLSDGGYDDSLVKSAHRVMQVLEFFAEYQRPAPAIMIARNLDLPQSSTSMLLRSLVALGYLHYEPVTRLYEPTVRLSLLGVWHRPLTTIGKTAIDLMKAIGMRTNECVLLAEQYRHYVRYIYAVQSTNPEKGFYLRLGTLRPICTTAFGQVLLSLKPDAEVRGIINRARSERDSIDYGLNMQKVFGQVKQCRRRGFARTSRQHSQVSSFQIAVQMPGSGDDHPLAVGVQCAGGGADRRADLIQEAVLDLVKSCSRDCLAHKPHHQREGSLERGSVLYL